MDRVTEVLKTARDWIATETEMAAMLATAGMTRSFLMLAIALACLCLCRRLDAIKDQSGLADGSADPTPARRHL